MLNLDATSQVVLFLLNLVMCVVFLANVQANAQVQAQSQQEKSGTTIVSTAERADVGLGRTTLQCAGYFRLPPLKGNPQIVGGEQEQEKYMYATGDYVYIDFGTREGVHEGQQFHIIRPRGEVKHAFRQKKGSLGVFVQEVGQLQVISAKESFSVAQMTYSCEPALPGDLLTGVPDRSSPEQKSAGSFDRFSDPNGKPTGRVVMAKDGRETVTVRDTIYLDLGDEDKIVPGDYVTIYRKVGTGHLNVPTYELAPGSDVGFASDRYRGGGFSMNVRRAKDRKGEEGLYLQGPIKTTEVKSKRPPVPRKVVGEAIIINVQVRTATAVITRVAQEVHTGDFVELQ